MGLQGWAAQHWYFVRTYPSHIHVVQFGLVWCDKHAECTYLIILRKQTKLSGRILHTESLRLNSSRVAFIWNPSLQLMVQYRGIWWQLCSDHSFIGGCETKFFWFFSKVKCSRKTAISSWKPFIWSFRLHAKQGFEVIDCCVLVLQLLCGQRHKVMETAQFKQYGVRIS